MYSPVSGPRIVEERTYHNSNQVSGGETAVKNAPSCLFFQNNVFLTGRIEKTKILTTFEVIFSQFLI
jgi:hypothetical protein